jgi:hypothetical protein
MPAFIQYYKSLNWKEKSSLNKKINTEAEIPYSTLYRKMENGNFTKLQKKAISEIIGISIDELFPN